MSPEELNETTNDVVEQLIDIVLDHPQGREAGRFRVSSATTRRVCKLCAAALALVLEALLWASQRRPDILAPPRPLEPHAVGCRRPLILVAHEQHLQAVGSDRRLLGLITQLSSSSVVSLLFRKAAPPRRRSPPTARLAALLGARSPTAHLLRPDVPPPLPPAIYELNGTPSFTALLRAARFDLILVGLWYWYDPQPSLAEVLLPSVYATRFTSVSCPAERCADRRSLVGLLVDDAHSQRARRIGAEETDAAAAKRYNAQARNFAARQVSLYRYVDRLLYLTAADRDAEAPLLPRRTKSRPSIQLLRMAVRPSLTARPHEDVPRSRDSDIRRRAREGMSSPHEGTARSHEGMASSQEVETARIGFVGDGHTPTNYLGVQRFLREGWPRLRQERPHVTLRLVGRPPTGHLPGQPERGAHTSCDATLVHCGWAWGTPCEFNETSCGIEVLGYLSDEQLRVESSSWQAMVVPIFATTGLNTKVLFGLEAGIPIVATATAALPFHLEPNNGTRAAALGNTSIALAIELSRLLDDPLARKKMAAAGSNTASFPCTR
ncbi:hypothetical protein AB1Y20_017969 [Prymnesium parvum]|uniref:Uncharacterized protein n=1 Tax=Prymnesium parvum TaxID=97485 RepID=A0AB34JQU0_PRYPA